MPSTRTITRIVLSIVLALTASAALAKRSSGGSGGSGGTGGQATLVLNDGNAELCHHEDTSWDLDQTLAPETLDGSGTLTWTITATRGATSTPELSANGYVSITNGGAVDATIGSILVNLQRKRGKSWITASSDVSNSTVGDVATSADICSGASSEGRSSFSENAYSGTLEFTDADTNTLWSIAPAATIKPGETVRLLYVATFDADGLGLSAGESVRTELIVSFGNAGGRGGSGASCTNVDINGNGALDADEANVRSVPDRQTNNVPSLSSCNDVVTLSADLSHVGLNLVSSSTDIGGGTFEQDIWASGTWTVTAEVECAGSGAASITDVAHLDGDSSVVVVDGPIDSLTGLPQFSFEFPCCVGTALADSDTAQVTCGGVIPSVLPGDFCGYTQGGWGARPNGNNPGALLANNFASVYPSGVEVGILGDAGHSMKLTSAAAIEAYLPAGGTASALTADLVNPTTTSSGVFGGQVLALRLNVDFEDAGVTGGDPTANYGDLVYCNAGDAFSGLSVRQILGLAELALGGGGPYTPSELNDLVTSLNEAMDNCSMTTWAVAHLVRDGCL